MTAVKILPTKTPQTKGRNQPKKTCPAADGGHDGSMYFRPGTMEPGA